MRAGREADSIVLQTYKTRESILGWRWLSVPKILFCFLIEYKKRVLYPSWSITVNRCYINLVAGCRTVFGEWAVILLRLPSKAGITKLEPPNL